MCIRDRFIYYAGIKNPTALKADGWEFSTNTFTVPSQKLESVDPENEAADVAVSEPIQLTFDRPLDKYTEWEIKFTPEVQYELEQKDNVLIIKFVNNLAQTQEYQYQINRTLLRYDLEKNEIIERKEPEEILNGKFITIKEPLVQSILPTGEGLFSDSEIKIVFEEDMLPDSVGELFKIEPAVAGEIIWPDAKTDVYKRQILGMLLYQVDFGEGFNQYKSLIVGHEKGYQFPVFQYFPIYIFGMKFGKELQGISNKLKVSWVLQLLLVSILTLLFAITKTWEPVIGEGYLFLQRWPP